MTSAADVVKPRGAGLVDRAIYIEPAQPSGAQNGDLWYNTTAHNWNQLVNGIWVPAVAGGGGQTLPKPNVAGDFMVAYNSTTWGPGPGDGGRY